MLVKCWDTGEKQDKNQSYRAPTGKYYTSKEAYETIVENTEWRNKCIDLYRSWVGRKDKAPSIWTKKMSEYKAYSPEIIYAAMLLSDSAVKYAVSNKTFNNEYQMAAYLWAIVNGKMIEADKKVSMRKQREADAKSQEQSYQYDDTIIQQNHNRKTIDISRFV